VNTHRRYHRAEHAVWRATTMDIVVLPGRGQELVRLSGSGVALWHALDRPRTIDETAALLAAAFDVPKERVVRDITPIFEDLRTRGVLLLEDDDEVEQSA